MAEGETGRARRTPADESPYSVSFLTTVGPRSSGPASIVPVVQWCLFGTQQSWSLYSAATSAGTQ